MKCFLPRRNQKAKRWNNKSKTTMNLLITVNAFSCFIRLFLASDYHVFAPFNPNDHCFHFLHTDMHSPLDSIPHIFGRMHAPVHRRTRFQHICTHTRSHAPSIPQQTFCCFLCLSLLVAIKKKKKKISCFIWQAPKEAFSPSTTHPSRFPEQLPRVPGEICRVRALYRFQSSVSFRKQKWHGLLLNALLIGSYRLLFHWSI